MRERGAEAAGMLHRLLAGTRTSLARIRLPIVPPTVTQLTGKDAPNRPYGELIDLGQQRMDEPPYAGRVLNVSVMGGFAYADTPFNGLTVVVTATDRQAADGLAREIAEAGWARRDALPADAHVVGGGDQAGQGGVPCHCERSEATLARGDGSVSRGGLLRFANQHQGLPLPQGEGEALHPRPLPGFIQSRVGPGRWSTRNDTGGARLRRCGGQSRGRRPRQHHVDTRGVPSAPGCVTPGRSDPRPGPGRRGARTRRRRPIHRPFQPRRRRRIFPPLRRTSHKCAAC